MRRPQAAFCRKYTHRGGPATRRCKPVAWRVKFSSSAVRNVSTVSRTRTSLPSAVLQRSPCHQGALSPRSNRLVQRRGHSSQQHVFPAKTGWSVRQKGWSLCSSPTEDESNAGGCSLVRVLLGPGRALADNWRVLMSYLLPLGCWAAGLVDYSHTRCHKIVIREVTCVTGEVYRRILKFRRRRVRSTNMGSRVGGRTTRRVALTHLRAQGLGCRFAEGSSRVKQGRFGLNGRGN
jgi:hypothetical protein